MLSGGEGSPFIFTYTLLDVYLYKYYITFITSRGRPLFLYLTLYALLCYPFPVTTVPRDKLGRILPGYSGNPSGRPKLNVSLVKMFKDKLEAEPATADNIINAWLKSINNLDFQAIREALDRIDGKVADKHLNVSVIAHIGEQYAQEVLAAMRNTELERQERLLLAEKSDI